MLTITLRDLQWRSRRFVLGALATALVFATTVLLLGLHASFLNETTRTVEMFHATRWIVPGGISGPFTTNSPVSAAALREVSADPGVQEADLVALFRHVAVYRRAQHDVNVIAYTPGGIVRPRIVAGRPPSGLREIVVDDALHVPLGAVLVIGGMPLRVVGRTRDLTYYGGTPAVLMVLGDGQEMAFGGNRLASAIVTRGVPTGPLPGLKAMTNEAVRSDLRRPLRAATATLGVIGAMLALVATGIVGLMVYLSGLDRRMDFAVFKATGARTSTLLLGLVLQALLLTLGAAAAAVAASAALAPIFPIRLEVSGRSYAELFAVAVVVGLLASAIGIRQATRVDPALAFGSN